MKRSKIRNLDVFINCSFSDDYRDFFRAIVFTVIRAGFNPRCALETDDSGSNRLDKIYTIIEQSKFAIHDLSNTGLGKESKLPRFNMPLEVGIFLGAKRFGTRPQKLKSCIILDREPYRYQKFISDIAGHDIHSHKMKPTKLISEIATWLRIKALNQNIPGGAVIAAEFQKMKKELRALCKKEELLFDELSYYDFCKIARTWISKRDA